LSGGEAVKNKIIVIDPGHGGRDPGATADGIYEKDLNLNITARLFILLKDLGFKVKMTRTDNRYLSLGDRVKIANDVNTDIFISIHCNAASSNKANGIETLYYPGSDKGKILAGVIQHSMIDKLNITDRGFKARPDLFVLKYTSMPAVLVECGFITNLEESELLITDKYRNDIAAAISDGVGEYYKKIK
jgi:N-acetylmuramoyl-L-alanine amidase